MVVRAFCDPPLPFDQDQQLQAGQLCAQLLRLEQKRQLGRSTGPESELAWAVGLQDEMASRPQGRDGPVEHSSTQGGR